MNSVRQNINLTWLLYLVLSTVRLPKNPAAEFQHQQAFFRKLNSASLFYCLDVKLLIVSYKFAE